MPKYLFSNDQRISALVERIQWVAEYVLSGKNLKNIPGKSDNNNAATLEFYYNPKIRKQSQWQSQLQ